MSTISGGEPFQKLIYAGVTVQNALYGAELVLYFSTMHSLLNHSGRRKKSDVFYAIFSTIMMLMLTIWVSTWAVFCEKMWLQDVSFPSGADAFYLANISAWYMYMGTLAIVVLQLMTDGLMIFRCWAIWDSYRIIILPMTLWVGALVLGALSSRASATGSGLWFTPSTALIVLSYLCANVSLSVTLTWLICYRLLRHGKLVKERLPHEYASPYFATVALIWESVLPYTLSGVVFLALLAAGSRGVVMALYVYVPMMCISPQMLILRVSMRTEWRDHDPHSTIQFVPLDITLESSSTESGGSSAV